MEFEYFTSRVLVAHEQFYSSTPLFQIDFGLKLKKIKSIWMIRVRLPLPIDWKKKKQNYYFKYIDIYNFVIYVNL